ncbi:MAG: DUF484 family protein [Pseudomonadales bacterium]|nr:DUF484 family protein [Pseudomonadales bacterium]
MTEADVAAWLEENPDFFDGRDALLLKMELPHAHSTNNGEAISLVERQVQLLRERNVETRHKLDEFLANARQNNAIFVKCQRLVLKLIEAKDSNGFFDTLENSFRKEFKSDAYSLIIFSEYAHQINHFTSSLPSETAAEYVGGLMKSKEPYLGVLRQAEQDFLFRHLSLRVKSAAVVSVRHKRQLALLAIGNSDPDYFRSGMGTEFITFIADVIARLLPRFVYLDPK